MAAAVWIAIPSRFALMDFLQLPMPASWSTSLGIDRTLARFTDPYLETHDLAEGVSGFWSALSSDRDGRWFTGISTPSGLAADHVYLIDPYLVLQAFEVRDSGTTTATTQSAPNLATNVEDSTQNFTSTTAPGDVFLCTNGAMANIVEVVSNTRLITEPLSMGQTYVAGLPYYIGRAPGTDTTDQYTVTGKRVNGNQAAIVLLEHWLTSRSFDSESASVGVSSKTTLVERIRTRLDELRGVRYGR